MILHAANMCAYNQVDNYQDNAKFNLDMLAPATAASFEFGLV